MEALASALEQGARLVDVREPVEFEHARVAGSVLVPLANVPEHIDEFDGDGPTYVICRSGARSLYACEFAVRQGHDAVNVAGGVLAWIDSGRPVDSGE